MEKNTEPIDFKHMRNADWKQSHMDMLSTTFNVEQGPLWRATLTTVNARDYVMSFGFHHSCHDGLSSLKIEGEFMELLNIVIDEREVDLGKRFILAPAMDDHIPNEHKSWKLRDFLFLYDHVIKEGFLNFKSSQMLNQKLDLDKKSKINFHTFEFKGKTFVNLLKISKQKGVTVNTTLTTIALVALARMLKERFNTCEHSFRIFFAFALRPYLPKDVFYHGMYSLTNPPFDYLINLECQEFWDIASNFGKYTSEYLKSDKIWDYLRVGKQFTNYIEKAVEYKCQFPEVKQDIFFSNLGNANALVKAENKYTTVNSICPTGYFRGSQCLWTHTFITIGQCLCWSIVFDNDRITMDQTKNYASFIEETFNKYIKVNLPNP